MDVLTNSISTRSAHALSDGGSWALAIGQTGGANGGSGALQTAEGSN